MSPKSPENFKEQLKSEKELAILIEEELIKESDLEPEEWVKKYGERFREIVKENPELLKDKEKLKKELEKEIIH